MKSMELKFFCFLFTPFFCFIMFTVFCALPTAPVPPVNKYNIDCFAQSLYLKYWTSAARTDLARSVCPLGFGPIFLRTAHWNSQYCISILQTLMILLTLKNVKITSFHFDFEASQISKFRRNFCELPFQEFSKNLFLRKGPKIAKKWKEWAVDFIKN